MRMDEMPHPLDAACGGEATGAGGEADRVLPLARWLYDLHDAARRGGPLSQILSVAGQLIPYQFVLFDGSYALVAYEPNGRPVPPSMQDVLEHGFAMHVSVEHQDAYRGSAREHPEGFSLEYEGDGEPVPLWVRPIRTMHGESYFLHVMGMRADDATSRDLVDELAAELSMALTLADGARGGMHGDLVQALVTERATEREVDERIRFFGWERTPSYRVVRVLAGEGFVPETQWRHHARRIAECLDGVHSSVMDEGLTLLLFDGAGDAGGVWTNEAVLERCLTEGGLVAGASDASCDWENIPRFYRQACDAVGMMRDWLMRARQPGPEAREIVPRAARSRRIVPLSGFRPRRERLCLFEECRLPLLLACVEKGDAEGDFAPQCVRMLEDYDRIHGSEYVATLQCYLRNLASKAATCRELAIHRTTLDYRLGRIAAVGAVDFDDALQLRGLVLWSFLAGA